mgnify:FL=1
MKLLGFLITILIAGILFGFGSMIRFFKSILGFDTKPQQRKKENEQLSRNKEDLSSKRPKIFSKDEGEYTDYEEV